MRPCGAPFASSANAIERNSVIQEGEPAPDFELPTDSGETIKLSSLRGQQVVLYFYPKDDTPGCTAQGMPGGAGSAARALAPRRFPPVSVPSTRRPPSLSPLESSPRRRPVR